MLKIMFCKRVAGQSCTWWCSGVMSWFRYHVPTTVQAWNTGRTGALDDDHCEGEFPNGLVPFGASVGGPSVTVSLQEVWTQGVAQSMHVSAFWSSNWNSKSRGGNDFVSNSSESAQLQSNASAHISRLTPTLSGSQLNTSTIIESSHNFDIIQTCTFEVHVCDLCFWGRRTMICNWCCGKPW